MTLPALMRLVFIACVIVCARAHRRLTTRPSCDDDYPNSTHALPMADPTISWYFQHYADCSRRAVWATFVNPRANFSFYVGVGVPTFQRFTGLRADALIIGPGLPAMLESDMAQVPAEVAADPAWGGAGVGAIYHRGPADQSTCAHLGAVMTRHSTVRNGRCDFYEPHGGTHSWRVLDADNNSLPVAGGTYYVAVFLQEHTSGKFGIALGTWAEDFESDIAIDTPHCARGMSDFFEKQGEQARCFPVVTCPAPSPHRC